MKINLKKHNFLFSIKKKQHEYNLAKRISKQLYDESTKLLVQNYFISLHFIYMNNNINLFNLTL